jgi:gamma-glutamylcyclotransferase
LQDATLLRGYCSIEFYRGDELNYNDYIAEYVAAGLIFAASFIIALLELFGGVAYLQDSTNPQAIIREFVSITSLPGAVVLLLCVLISYPIGYLFFALSLNSMKLFGRQSIYEKETAILTRRPYRDQLQSLAREAPKGYAGDADFERSFALVRLYLLVRQKETFAILNAYWTRLSRTFGALTSSFFFSGVIFFLLWVSTLCHGEPSWVSQVAPWVAGMFFILFGLTVLAYRRSLQNELRNFVAVFLSTISSDSSISNQRVYVFAYGSNMLTKRLEDRITILRYCCTGRIFQYKLYFNKRGSDGSAKANIRFTGCDKDEVWGVIFEVSKESVSILDDHEPNYDRVRIHVHTQSGPGVMADVYRASSDGIEEELLPYDWYLKVIIAGAKEHNLPESYVSLLESTTFVADPDEERRRNGLNLLNR